MNALTKTLGLILTLTLGACATQPMYPEPLPEPDYSARATAPTDGAIYQQSGGLLWFEDRLASRVGDSITVILAERTQAQKTASTSTAKDSDFSVSVPMLGGVVDGLGVDSEIGSGRAFSGSGDSSQSNSLEGELTVLVTERLSNGYLRVAGEKTLQLNQGTEYLRLTGIVRPEDISPQNTVPSTRIAQAQIAYSGQGPVAQSNAMGWLSRVFNSPLWPL